ncbi:MAG: class I SAM-dependent methyltransferase [Solirubrobacterales bacterium]
MAEASCDIGDFSAEIYDACTPPSRSRDCEWYVELARGTGGPVLELGAGSGRITLAVAAAGVPVHAFDRDAGMLAALERKLGALDRERDLVTPVLGDFRELNLGARFKLVLAPFSVLLYNRSQAQLVECLRRVRQHLLPGGKIAFDVFDPDDEYIAANLGRGAGTWRWTGMFPSPDGGLICCSEATVYEPASQTFTELRRFELLTSAGAVRSQRIQRFDLAYFYADDLHRALEAAGFASIEVKSGFGGTGDDGALVAVALAPEQA